MNLQTARLDDTSREVVIATPASNGGPQVRIFQLSKTAHKLVTQFFAYSSGRRMGLSVAVGNILQGGGQEIMVSPTEGKYPVEVRIFSSRGALRKQFYPASDRYRNGADLSAGDLYAFDNTDEMLTSTYANDIPGVFVFRRKNETALQHILSFYAYNLGFRGGVRTELGHFGL